MPSYRLPSSGAKSECLRPLQLRTTRTGLPDFQSFASAPLTASNLATLQFFARALHHKPNLPSRVRTAQVATRRTLKFQWYYILDLPHKWSSLSQDSLPSHIMHGTVLQSPSTCQCQYVR